MKMRVIGLILSACLLTAGGAAILGAQVMLPSQISAWIDRNQREMIYGMGVSTAKSEVDALRQSRAMAREDLASNVETRVQNMITEVSRTAGEDSFNFFENVSRQVVYQTIQGAKSYGPFTNSKGSTYMIMYFEDEKFRKSLFQITDEFFGKTESALDRMLDEY
jgi:hypothetical protein